MTPEEMQRRIVELENRLNRFEQLERFVFSKKIQMADGLKIQLGTSEGLLIGTAASEKIGLWGVTPTDQYAAADAGAKTGFTSNSAANMNGEDSTHTGQYGSTAYTFGDVIQALKKAGIIEV